MHLWRHSDGQANVCGICWGIHAVHYAPLCTTLEVGYSGTRARPERPSDIRRDATHEIARAPFTQPVSPPTAWLGCSGIPHNVTMGPCPIPPYSLPVMRYRSSRSLQTATNGNLRTHRGIQEGPRKENSQQGDKKLFMVNQEDASLKQCRVVLVANDLIPHRPYVAVIRGKSSKQG